MKDANTAPVSVDTRVYALKFTNALEVDITKFPISSAYQVFYFLCNYVRIYAYFTKQMSFVSQKL